MNKGKHLGLILLATLLLCSCHKEGVGRLELLLEPMGDPAAKLAVSQDSMAVWSDGDMINFNDVPTEVRREGEHAYIDATSSQTVNRACYPAGIVAAFSGGDEVTVTLPAAYHYRIDDNGAQLVDMPLAARAEDGKPLMFKHLTAAICVNLTNSQSSGQTLTIDSITVTSDAFRLSGDYPLNLNAIESFGAQVLGGGGSDNRVTMFFDRQRLEIPYRESRKVLIPVPPVGSTNHFTITVAARYQGKRYNYSQTQTTGGALDRKVLAYALKTLSGATARNLFVGEGSKTTPYQIGNACDWIAMTEAVTNGWTRGKSPGVIYNAACYKLMNSIDMDGITLNPIENYAGARFDGNGKSVSNISISGTGDKLGLFGTINNVGIVNFSLINPTFQHTGNSSELCFGTIAGYTSGIDTLEHCTVSYSQTLSLTATSCLYYGGLVGSANSSKLELINCEVSNSSLQLTTSNAINAGGLVGKAYNVIMNLRYCTWSGTMTFFNSGSAVVGKLIGLYNYVGSTPLTITNSSGTGTVTVNGNACTQNVGNKPAY